MDKTRRNHQHQIFVASSLELQDKRDAVTEAVAEYNKNHPGTYSCIRYEKDITQCLDKKSAQREVNNFLVKSPIFFLIAEQNKIKEKSEKEFELALEHFRNEELPRFIFIFNSGTEKDILTEKGENLLKKYGLNDYRIDSHGELITYPQVYYIPFSDTTGLKDRILEQLERLPKRLPPTKAKLGSQLVKEDFYTDHNRLDKFPTHYYPRPAVDDMICERMKNQRVILVTGHSLSGKTRSVMEALREVNDGWVYVIGDRRDELVKELEILRKHLRVDSHVKLYIEIDNLDQLITEEAFREPLKDLVNMVMTDNCYDTIVATASNSKTVENALSLDKNNNNFSQIVIPPLSVTEYHTAIAWFKSCGDTIVTDRNKGYLQIGALFVDLSELETLYRNFLETDTVVRLALLKAIKAQSIWRDDAFGDKNLLKSMTNYFAQNGQNEPRIFNPAVYQDAISALCERGKMGVTKLEKDNHGALFNKQLHIEEYVYQYVIGYDGKPTESVLDDDDQVELEKGLILDIISYCIDQQIKVPQSSVGKESLTRQVSRIMRRCDHPIDVVPWLFNMWRNGNEDTIENALKEDREKCEGSKEGKEDHFYAGIVKVYLSIMTKYEKSFNLDSSLNVYDNVPEKFRKDELFAKLIRVANCPEERKRICNHPDYKEFQNKPVSVIAEMDWYDDYDKDKELFDRVTNPCSGKNDIQIAVMMLSTNGKPYDIFFYGHLLRELAKKVHTKKDFDDLVSLLRKNYVCLLSDRKLLEKIKNQEVIINENNLTLIDLFSALGMWYSSQCVMNVFGENLQSCEKLEQDLLHCLKQTLDNKLTTELQMRMIVSTLCEKLIRGIAKNSDYEDVYDVLFAPLEIDHPNRREQKIIFRNVYTYTAMMECRNTDVQTSMNLFTNDLRRHAEDRDNPLSITSYTLNRMLSKCYNEKSTYIDQINNLYNQLGLKRDIFTYNVLINTARNLPSVYKILETIKEENLTPDLYTYLNILRNNDIDFQEAIRFLYNSDCIIEGCSLSGNSPDIFSHITPGEQIRQNLHSMKQAWISLFRKNAREDRDKKNLEHCLEHLREKHAELLTDGYIYNVLLENNSFFQDLKEAIDYIENTLIPHGFKPDGYTADALLTRVYALKGIDQLGAIGAWNNFIINHPNCLNQTIISRRIQLFRKQGDTLTLVFFDENKKPISKESYSPIQYLRQMVSLNFPIDASVVRDFLKINSIKSRKTYQDIAEQIRVQNYTPTAEDIRTVRELILPYCEDNELPEVYSYSRMTTLDYNKSISWNFKVLHPRNDTKNITRKEVEETLNRLRWDDINSALWALTEILDKYVENRRESLNGKMWSIITSFYNQYIVPKYVPTSFTFTLLAKSLTQFNKPEDRKWLFCQLKKYSSNIIVSPHLLGELARTVTTVDALIKQTKAICNLGCKPNAHTADTYVFWLNCNLMNSDEEHAKPILTDLMQYILSDERERELTLLQTEERKYLLLDTYKDLHNISAVLLHTLLSFNYKTQIYRDKTELAAKISAICSDDTITGLMTRLVDDKNLHDYVPLFFNKRRNYSTKVLRYLTQQLPRHDINKYNELMRKFYEYNCAIPESVVPNLLQCLSGYDCDEQITEEWKKQITEKLKKVYINITQNWLRQGDLIMEKQKVPDQYKDWCHPSLNCLAIHDLFDERKQNIYPTLIKLYSLCDNLDLDINRSQFKALHRAEEMYAYRIREWQICLEELASLPKFWCSIRRRPSEELILSIIRVYLQQPARTAKYIVDISRSLSFAQKHEKPITRVYYKSIGDFQNNIDFYKEVTTEKLEKIMPHPFIIDLCFRMASPKNYSKKENGQTKSKQNTFIEKIQNRELDSKQIDSLPPLLMCSNWYMSEDLEKIIKERLIKMGYIHLMQYISKLKGYYKSRDFYLEQALKGAETIYTEKVRQMRVPLKELNTLANLWEGVRTVISTWNPDAELITVMIGFFGHIPDIATKQIVSIKKDADNAQEKHYYCSKKNNLPVIRIKYASLVDHQIDSATYIPIEKDRVLQAMPHDYIIGLCRRMFNEMNKTADKKIKWNESEYIKLVESEAICQEQLRKLPYLWVKARNWMPSEDLQKLVNQCDN